MEFIASGLGDHADLPAGSCSQFRGVIVGVDAKLLHVLKTALQTEWRNQFASDVTGACVDDGGSLNAVKTNCVLFYCAPAESDVAKRPGTRVLRARRLKIQLRELSAVDGQVMTFAGVSRRFVALPTTLNSDTGLT